jgi:hypothetical protein
MQNSNSTYLNSCNHLFSWSAVFSGVLVAIGIGALFSLLGSGIGLALFQPDAKLVYTLSIAGVIWAVVGGTISMFLGGMVTGYLSFASRTKAKIYGLVMWSLSFIAGLILVASGASMLLTGASQFVSSSVSISTQLASAAIKPIANKAADNLDTDRVLTEVANKAERILENSAKKSKGENLLDDSQEKEQGAISSIRNFITNNDENNTEKLRNEAITQITDNTNLSQQQAEELLDKWQQNYEKLSVKTQEIVRYSSNALSAVTLCALVVMLLGALATIWGSSLGAKPYNKI